MKARIQNILEDSNYRVSSSRSYTIQIESLKCYTKYSLTKSQGYVNLNLACNRNLTSLYSPSKERLE